MNHAEGNVNKDIRVASVQFEHAAGDKQANFVKIRGFVEKAARQRVEMISFPECCITGYWHLRRLSQEELTALAEPVFDGPSSQTLVSLAKAYKMTIGAGLVEMAEDGALYSTYVVAMPNGECQRHRKIHCFINEHMASGSGYTVFDTPFFTGASVGSSPSPPSAGLPLRPGLRR